MVNFLKKILPKSISARLFIICTTPVLLSQLFFGFIFFGNYTDSVIKIISNQISGDILAVISLMEFKCDNKIIEQVTKNLQMSVEIISNFNLEKQGISRNFKSYRTFKRILKKNQIEKFYIKPQGNKIIVYIQSKDNNNVYKISFSRKTLYMKIVHIVLGWSLLSSLILLFVAALFLKNQLRPIKNLAYASKKFGEGQNIDDFIPSGATEIRLAGESFCEMKTNIKKLMNSKLLTLAGISHDLRTPLTKMKLQLSMMPQTSQTKFLMSDVNTMINITESFLVYAKCEVKEMSTQKKLKLFIEEIVDEFKTDNFEIILQNIPNIEFSLKPISLKRAFSNIILNSKKYSSKLFLNCFIKNSKIFITFEDNGPGIDQNIIDKIFEPFFQANLARTANANSNGVGLGLAISKEIVENHGGKIFAGKSAKFSGMLIEIVIPL